ncbi:MAG TPA: glucose-6-phosphate isomerase [Burkholderiaceae bacterium]|nr:glucose-6-phosphate isomerase [Burkholderiaceae bacterium]
MNDPRPQAWQRAADEAQRLRSTRLRDLLLGDPTRPQRFSRDAAGLFADFSKQRIDAGALDAMLALARASEFERRRDALFAGEIVNPTEQRAALHCALRGVGGSAQIRAEVSAALDRMRRLATSLRSRSLHGFRRAPIQALVCIGIGGSDLGPRLVCDALAEADSFPVRFVANVDPDDLARELRGLDPATTAIAVVSKTFTTRETLANADAARGWLAAGGCPASEIGQHLIAVTAAPQAAVDWGVTQARVLPFWDWVGGRYSLWSSVGLGIAVALGPDRFDSLLDGAAQIDRHFLQAPLEQNLPATMGLVSVWNRSLLQLPALAVVPYAERLRLLPAYLQQLVMESNGKSATLRGTRVERPTAPIIWGASGTNAQHSFFQQLHQGPDVVPIDFIVAARSSANGDERHRILFANCLAQSAALALGRDADDPHRHFPGNRPSTTLVLPQLDAGSLGALIACYEHATFSASVLLDINPFDQFGVEYGKALAKSVEALLGEHDGPAPDPSTAALARRFIG